MSLLQNILLKPKGRSKVRPITRDSASMAIVWCFLLILIFANEYLCVFWGIHMAFIQESISVFDFLVIFVLLIIISNIFRANSHQLESIQCKNEPSLKLLLLAGEKLLASAICNDLGLNLQPSGSLQGG